MCGCEILTALSCADPHAIPFEFSFTKLNMLNMMVTFVFGILSYLDGLMGKADAIFILKLVVQLGCVYVIMFGKFFIIKRTPENPAAFRIKMVALCLPLINELYVLYMYYNVSSASTHATYLSNRCRSWVDPGAVTAPIAGRKK
jgi:hypothetical protein